MENRTYLLLLCKLEIYIVVNYHITEYAKQPQLLKILWRQDYFIKKMEIKNVVLHLSSHITVLIEGTNCQSFKTNVLNLEPFSTDLDKLLPC